MNHAYIFLADGFEETEALATLDVLRRGVSQIDGVNQGGDPFIFCHARCRDIIEDPGVMHSFIQPDGLFCFEQSRP